MTIDEAIKSGRDISICNGCAKANGGVWPEYRAKDGSTYGHVATCWAGECGVCGKVAGCCALSDWQWPGKKGGTGMARRREI